MTAKEFIKNTEDYYGQYTSDFIKTMVYKYLCDLETDILDKLFRLVILNFSSQYNKVPDVAAIETIRRNNKQEFGQYIDTNGQVYENGSRIGHFANGRFIPYLGDLNPGQIKNYANNYKSLEYLAAFKEYLKECRQAKEIEDKRNDT